MLHVVALAALALRVVVALDVAAEQPSFGVWNFYLLGDRPGVPYADFDVEYPIALLAVVRALAWASGSLESFNDAVVWLNLAADLASAALLSWIWGRHAALLYLVASAPLTVLVYGTLDSLPTFATLLAVVSMVRARPLAAGGAWAVATFLKLWPAPFGLLELQSPTRWRFAAAGTISGGALLLTWLAMGGVDGIRQVVSYRGATGWEIGTIPGLTLLAIEGADAIVPQSGADRIGVITGAERAIVAVAGFAFSLWAFARGSRTSRLGTAWVTGTTSLLVFSTLLSPQFIWWLVPGAAIAWTEGWRLGPILVAAAAALTGLEMARWEWVLEARGEWLLLVAARNVLLIVILCAGAIELRRADGPSSQGTSMTSLAQAG